ncbi:MAG: ArnT family glycosyltransferase [Geminicoccaceae bacterium]
MDNAPSDTDHPPAPDRTPGWLRWLARAPVAYPFMVVFALAVYLPGFFVLPPSDRDESRYAQASKQMVQSGDWIDIRFGEEPRYKKPAGIYWLQAGAVSIVGSAHAQTIWLYRLPSLIGCLLSVLLTLWLGRFLFGSLAGLIGAFALTVCILMGTEARMAKTDAVLLGAILLAQALLARAALAHDDQRPGWAAVLGFWAAHGVGILVKGPIGLMVTALNALAFAVWQRRFRWLLGLRPLPGLAILAALVAPWLIAIQIASDGAFLQASLGREMLYKVGEGEQGHGAPPGFYLALFPVTFWPMAALSVLALPWIWRQRRDARVRFLLSWIVPVWAVFALVTTKLPHYMVPVYPAIALLTGAAIADGLRGAARPPGRAWQHLATALFGALALALVGAVAVLPMLADSRVDAAALLFAIALAALFAAAAQALQHFAIARFLLIIGISAPILSYAAYDAVLARLETIWLAPKIRAAVAEYSPCAAPVVASSGFTEPSLVFALGKDTITGGPARAAAHLAAPGCNLALIEAGQMARFEAALADQAIAARPLTGITGYNYNGGDWLDLRLFAAVDPAGDTTVSAP